MRLASGASSLCLVPAHKMTILPARDAAPTCRARIRTARLGECRTQLIAKNITRGIWATIRICQMCAAVPSSGWGAVPLLR